MAFDPARLNPNLAALDAQSLELRRQHGPDGGLETPAGPGAEAEAPRSPPIDVGQLDLTAPASDEDGQVDLPAAGFAGSGERGVDADSGTDQVVALLLG